MGYLFGLGFGVVGQLFDLSFGAVNRAVQLALCLLLVHNQTSLD
jgi:hypothetical protein